MTTIPIQLVSDEKGYFDRECPNEECHYTFKILMADWKEKVSDEEVHCPMCGHVDTSDKWWTQDQLEKMQEIAASWFLSDLQKEMNKSFEKLERSTRHNKYARWKYKPGKKITFINNPIGQSEEWETEICCEKCGTHYSVIGSAFFCPCCGYNSVTSAYKDSLDSIKRMLDTLPEMKELLIEKYDEDSAVTMCRSLLESSIGNMVSAFQKFACCRYEAVSGKSGRVNDFQMVEKGSQLFKDEIGESYSDWLENEELEHMKVMFQRRHILEHNNGLVDQKYLDKSKDMSYSVGQRVVVKETDAYTLLEIVRKLGDALSMISLT